MTPDEMLHELVGKTKNIVVIGEAGSGKTEVSLNLAAALEKLESRQVHFFDMDQTKPILRARDSSLLEEKQGVTFHYQPQHMDAPTVAAGVIECLTDNDRIVLLDVGGGEYGSHMIGQFEEYLNQDNTVVLFLVNPYRPWSCNREYIEETMRRTLGAAHLERIVTAANPNLGPDTTAETVLRGLEKVRQLLPEWPPLFLTAETRLVNDVAALCDIPVLPLELSIGYSWLAD